MGLGREQAYSLSHVHALLFPLLMYRLWDYLKRPPLRLMVLEEKAAPDTGGREEQLNPGTEEVLLAAPRIMAVAWGSNQEPEGPTALVLLDEHGEAKCTYNSMLAGNRWGSISNRIS
jgi:hypothetical protein